MAEEPANLQRTPVYQQHVDLGARMVPFGGWEMPLSYEGQLAEHKAVRENVGIFDVSHMGQVRFTGTDICAFLQWLVPGNMATLKVGRSRYTQLVNERGGILDDLIVSRLGERDYFAVVNAATHEKDLQWIRQKAEEWQGNVTITDESAHWAMIAVQGPKALELLDKLLPDLNPSQYPAFGMVRFEYEAAVHYLSRTGYTGEVGAEILCPERLAEHWWSRLVEAGAVPCGLAARDSLRLEAGYCLSGQDIHEETTPIEANLGWSVSKKKEEQYIGREILEKQRAEGPAKKLVGLRAEGRRPLRHGDSVVADGEEAGEVTSGGFSPILQCGIAFAYVNTDSLDGGNLAVRSRGKDIPVQVVTPPFVSTSLQKSSKT